MIGSANYKSCLNDILGRNCVANINDSSFRVNSVVQSEVKL
jgi:hypothetical protein